MPPEIVLYALADIIVLVMMVLIALTPTEEEPRLEPPVEYEGSQSSIARRHGRRRWLR